MKKNNFLKNGIIGGSELMVIFLLIVYNCLIKLRLNQEIKCEI